MKEITIKQAQYISGAGNETDITYNAAWIAVAAFSGAVIGQLIYNGPNYDLPVDIAEAAMVVALLTIGVVGGQDPDKIIHTKPV